MSAESKLRNLQLNKPSLFTPTVNRALKDGDANSVLFQKFDGTLLADSNIDSTSSFRYDLPYEGIKSTQQLNVDWTDFANHTFFNSAQVKTNVAFERIINEFPFDGTKKEYEAFFDKLTGFEKYVFDSFPKNKGFLFFRSAIDGTTPAYVTVKDRAGSAYPELSSLRTGDSYLSPNDDHMTVEMQLWLPALPSTASMIIDKHVTGSAGSNELYGFSLVVSASNSTNTGSLYFYVMSGSSFDQVLLEIPKGEWAHVAWVWNRTPDVLTITSYLNQVPFASSSQPIEFGSIDCSAADLLIGSGSAIGTLFTPSASLSGAIDELRIWKSVRTVDELTQYRQKNVFSDENMLLYYKFNEPSGSNSALVLDHSSNSMHGRLSAGALTLGVREYSTASLGIVTPMLWEKPERSPVLFSGYAPLRTLKSSLLLSASTHDESNPNLITRLVPPHYFIEGQEQDALATEIGEIIEDITGGSDPRTVKLGATQVLLSLLYSWAKYFDELKLYIQAFSTLYHVDYDQADTIPDQFLHMLAKNEGMTLPPLFKGTSIEQYIEAENLQDEISTNTFGLQYIQNQIWRRILINLKDVMRSKGTLHAIKSFIRSTGIDPDNNFRIREFGGPDKATLGFARDKRSEVAGMLDFVSGGLIISPPLSMSRTEPGFPAISGTLANGSTRAQNGLLTSGSWTVEGTYRFDPSARWTSPQSLARLYTTGSAGGALLANLVATQSGGLDLYVRPENASGSNLLSLHLISSASVLDDGDQWYVSFGRQRNDDPALSSVISSSYFIRAAKQNFGEITETYFTSSMFMDATSSLNNMFQSCSLAAGSYNFSGAYLAIGSQSIDSISNLFLNDTDVSIPAAARTTSFTGRIAQLRFWSKYLTHEEWPEHVRNFRSVGVVHPNINFNFEKVASGSWERLRLDCSMDQPLTRSNAAGNLELTDFAQNSLHMSASGFPATSSIIRPERFYYSYVSPKYDLGGTTEKVRARSFQDYNNVLEKPWYQVAPVYEIEPSETPTDNTRLTIDFSVVDALDQDIATIFATLTKLDNVIGSPELMFSPDYPDLEVLRTTYFNKLTGKINLKGFFEFYKWFDTNIGTFVAQLIPRKTHFLGTNFVIESHMLERAKYEYNSSDHYLGDNSRDSNKHTILLQLITGDFVRY